MDPSFLNCPTFKTLEKLAKSPFDLTKADQLTSKRMEEFTCEAIGYQLMYGTERVNEEVMQSLLKLAFERQLLSKMKRMQSGEVMNRSENRQVLHTSARDLFSPSISQAAQKAADLSKREQEKLKKFLNQTSRFTDLISIGIGGSDLGPRAIYNALKRWQKPGRRVHFISNVDPDDAASVMQNVSLKNTLVLITSKSGTTLETATNEAFLRARFEEEKLKPEEHFVSVTAEGSPLDDPSRYLACFYSWDFVGGRFSSTSMYGGVMLSFAIGYENFLDFLRGAHEMDQVALEEDPKKNLPLIMALLGIWNRNFLNYETLAIIPYSQALLRFAAHIQQLDMESNGKHVDENGKTIDFQTGPIIWGEPGTNSQHSFFQLLHQGTSIVPVEFIGFKESQYSEDYEYRKSTSQEKLLSNLFAQTIALATGQSNSNPNKQFSGNRPSLILLGKQLTPYAMGALLALYEHKVAFQGFMWGLNSFDQEGVTLGKQVANKMIDLFIAKRYPSEPKSSFSLGEFFLRKL